MSKPKSKTKAKSHEPTGIESASEQEDLNQLLARSEQDNVGLLNVLEQAQNAQRALLAAQKRIKALELKQEERHGKALAALSAQRDQAQDAADAAGKERDALQSSLASASKGLRALASSLARMPDPLAPLSEDDSADEFDKLRAALRDAAERKDGDAEAEAAARARALADGAVARIGLQGNRVKLLRKHVEDLEADRAKAEERAEDLGKSLQSKEAELKQAAARAKESQTAITALRKDLDATGTKLDRANAAANAAEGAWGKERDALASEHKIAKARASELDKSLTEARKQARSAERLAADLAQAILGSADEMIAAGEVDDAPAIKGARGELEELVNDLAEAVEDDLEAACREDLCEDLMPACKAVIEVMVGRHARLHEAMSALEKTHAKLAARQEAAAAGLEQERQTSKATKAELVRANAQLRAAQHEAEAVAKELAARQKELSEAKGELARLGAETEALTAQAAQAKSMRTDLDGMKAEAERLKAEAKKQAEAMKRCDDGLQALGKSLVDLATATEGALVAGGLRSEGFVGRFTRSMRKLEGDVGKQQSDVPSLIRSSTEMVDKAAGRIGQLQAELTRRGEALVSTESERASLARERDELAHAAKAREDELRALKEERDDHQATARRLSELEPSLARRDEELATLRSESLALAASLKGARSELDEVIAREDAAVGSLDKELVSARKRTEDAQTAQRAADVAAAESREEAEAKLATAEGKAQELERGLEARDHRIATLQQELSSAVEIRAKVAEVQRRAEAAASQLAKANERVRDLEAQMEGADDGEVLRKELAGARGERDEPRQPPAGAGEAHRRRARRGRQRQDPGRVAQAAPGRACGRAPPGGGEAPGALRCARRGEPPHEGAARGAQCPGAHAIRALSRFAWARRIPAHPRPRHGERPTDLPGRAPLKLMRPLHPERRTGCAR